MKAQEARPQLEEPAPSARIEVPVFSAEPALPDKDVQELGAVDELQPTAAPAPIAARWPEISTTRHRSAVLLAIPLIVLILGLIGFALLRDDRSAGDAEQDTAAQPATTPESAAEPAVSSVPNSGEAAPSEDSIAITKEPEISGSSGGPEVADVNVPKSPVKQVPETRASDTSRNQDPTVAESRSGTPAREQARNRTAASNRTGRSMRPRVVDEEVFEQPPVSSIESIMTGIPDNRQQRRWEVLEEDRIRRERRLRRIDRRNRQRWPLF
jgi:hypothetical protein